jgi:5-bromo-4-chloroindolyl phosphate hydrolysis protein
MKRMNNKEEICEMCEAIETLEFTVPTNAYIFVKINWKRIYDFLKENPDISYEEFLHNMESIVELEDGYDDLVRLFGGEKGEQKSHYSR